VCLGDALDDRQAEADTCMAVADPSGATPKRLDDHGKQLW
jgi:hypothetical protein